MYLSSLTVRNFRQFGDGGAALEIAFNCGVTALVGRNDSSKSAVIDAIRYALLTRDQEFIRIQPEDFHLEKTGESAADIFIRCKLEGGTDKTRLRQILERLKTNGVASSLLTSRSPDGTLRRGRNIFEAPPILACL